MSGAELTPEQAAILRLDARVGALESLCAALAARLSEEVQRGADARSRLALLEAQHAATRDGLTAEIARAVARWA